MTANQTLLATKEQALSILKSSYCVINNWGGSRFHYVSDPKLELENCCALFENDKVKTHKFSLEGAKIVIDSCHLRLISVEGNIPYVFLVLTKANLKDYIQ